MELKNLNFSFTPTSGQLLFEDFNLRIEPNEITVLLGPSGSGKSTLLRIFSKIQPISSKKLALVKDLRTESFIFQEANLLEWLTGYKNIMLPKKLAHQNVDNKELKQISKALKIEDCLALYPHQLSGGQKMRVSVARALITRPEVIYMDEPFAALDEPTRLELQDELLAIQSRFKMTILFVTHSFYEAAYLADRIIVINQQRPARIISDVRFVRDFKSRFDDKYQLRVQGLSETFKKGLA